MAHTGGQGPRGGADLEVACRALLEAVAGIEFHAAGRLTMGADHRGRLTAGAGG